MLGILVCWQAKSGVRGVVVARSSSLLASGTKMIVSIPMIRYQRGDGSCDVRQGDQSMNGSVPSSGCPHQSGINAGCCPAPDERREKVRLPQHATEILSMYRLWCSNSRYSKTPNGPRQRHKRSGSLVGLPNGPQRSISGKTCITKERKGRP